MNETRNDTCQTVYKKETDGLPWQNPFTFRKGFRQAKTSKHRNQRRQQK